MADGWSPPVGRGRGSSWQSQGRQHRCALPIAPVDVLLEVHQDRWYLRWCNGTFTLTFQILRRLTYFVAIIWFWPVWRNGSCSSTLCACRSTTLRVRVVQNTAR